MAAPPSHPISPMSPPTHCRVRSTIPRPQFAPWTIDLHSPLVHGLQSGHCCSLQAPDDSRSPSQPGSPKFPPSKQKRSEDHHQRSLSVIRLTRSYVFFLLFSFVPSVSSKCKLLRREKRRTTTEKSHLYKHEIFFEFLHRRIQNKCHTVSRGQNRRGSTVRILQKDHRTNYPQYQQEGKCESFGALHRRM